MDGLNLKKKQYQQARDNFLVESNAQERDLKQRLGSVQDEMREVQREEKMFGDKQNEFENEEKKFN